MSCQLTVIIPCFNEQATIGQVIDRVADQLKEIDHECLVVDDGSTDRTLELAKQAGGQHCTVIGSPQNEGKTAAVRRGLELAKGKYVIIQDADLEYDPSDIPGLLQVAIDGDAVAVYGKRPSHWMMPSRWALASGVLLVDVVIAVLHGGFVRDHATCYKLIRRDVLQDMNLETSGFEGCVEITCKLIRGGHKITQVPISYTPRRYADGKKLTWTHGINAVREAWRRRK